MVLRRFLGFLNLGKPVKLQEYRKALERAVSDGVVTPEEERYLLSLRDDLGLSSEDAYQIALDLFSSEVNAAVSDDELTIEEQIRLHKLKEALELRDEDIKQELEKIAELIVLRDVQNGKLPEVPTDEARKHLIMASDEVCHCLVSTGLYKRIVKQVRGRYRGWSFRISPGVYYRTGTYTPPEIKEEITKVDEGILAITNKRLIFMGKHSDLDVPLQKIVGVEIFRDAIGIHRKGRKEQEFFVLSRPKLIGAILHVAAIRKLEGRKALDGSKGSVRSRFRA